MQGVPIDILEFRHALKSAFGDPAEVPEGPREGVYTFGPYLEGGRWDLHSQQIEDCRPGELYSRMPVVHFIPVRCGDPLARDKRTRNSGSVQSDGADSMISQPRVSYGCVPSGVLQYECPFYKTAARTGELSTTGQSTNHVCTVVLPTAIDPEVWVLKGVALICEPEE